ncbi:hypothetical protein U9M48_014267, partial [Paspalum notatum var. saurae]
DGSSLCCCWADDARAELLLRLQEIAHLDASVNLKFSKGGNSTKSHYTIGSCLEKMLKKHTRVTVKNCGNIPDFSCRDLDASSVSDKVLSRLEDKLLKFIILNACWKGNLNVIASVLNPDDLNGFNVELTDFPIRNMQILWIEEVLPVDPLEEARRLYGNMRLLEIEALSVPVAHKGTDGLYQRHDVTIRPSLGLPFVVNVGQCVVKYKSKV